MLGRDLGRREFLTGVGAGAAGLLAASAWLDVAAVAAEVAPIDPNYPLGVAAGDPRPHGAVIWTRVAPPSPTARVAVTWQVATDASFRRIVRHGRVDATATTDHTVKVLVPGLEPDRWYHYRFRTTSGTSRSGRLRTAPRAGCMPRRLRFAFSSCQQINDSHYVAHLAMADEDIDFWVHYGDYVYVHDFATLTLADYRQVYQRFKANPLLQELHARYPVVAMWDDGEFVNGVDRTMEPTRFAAAKQAWFEYQPVVRRRGDPDRTYREITWGDLASFLLLDVRQYRDPWPPGTAGGPLGLSTVDTRTESGAHIFDADRTCLGRRQKGWLKRRLLAPEPRWRHVGHGYNFLALRLEDFDTPEARANPPAGFHLNGGSYVASDAWDAYWAERRELMTFLDEHEVPNVLVTAGHTHIYFAGGLRPDYDDLATSPVVAHEFVCGSLTADPDLRRQYLPNLPLDEAEAVLRGLEGLFLAGNPHIDYMDLVSQGYGVVELTPSAANVELRVIDTFDRQARATTRAAWEVPADPHRRRPRTTPRPADRRRAPARPGAERTV
jgi:alkaline phosphatase D